MATRPKSASAYKVYKVDFLFTFHFIDQLSALQQLITSMLMRKTDIEACYYVINSVIDSVIARPPACQPPPSPAKQSAHPDNAGALPTPA